MTSTAIEKRRETALKAIKEAFGTEAGEGGITLFIEHHIQELPESYWEQHLGTNTPEAAAVLGLIEFRKSWGEDDLEYFDFTLPGEVTQYVVSVRFDAEGRIEEISMES
jgi:Protein of unknown function (DUF2004)